MEEFGGKVVLITGASSGIGAETALEFASSGASLALVGRDEERLEKSAQDCLAKGLSKEKVLTIKADMCIEDDVKRIMDSTITHFGKLDVLVNNAGLAKLDFLKSDEIMQNFDELLKINVRSAVQLTNLAVPHLIASKGCVVNMSSFAGKRVSSMSLSYNITRAANDQFTRCCALDLASKGVRVNAVNPGAIETPLLTGFGVPVDQIEEVMGKLHPMGRVGQSSEVAKAIKFLASDAASFITGETLSIDGGRHVACAR
ncbi:3-oxoacyl-[acyl-carrier-protein] reductase FabG-like isoform X2 [Lytechinus pictus]